MIGFLDGNSYAAKEPIGRGSPDVVCWKNCPHCNGRGTWLANPFFVHIGSGIHHQCLSCTRAQEFWKAKGREPDAAELAALFPGVKPPAPPEPPPRKVRKPFSHERLRRRRARPLPRPIHFGLSPAWATARSSFLRPLCGIYGSPIHQESTTFRESVTCRRCLAIIATDPARLADVGMALAPGEVVRGASGSTHAVPWRWRLMDIGERVKLIDATGVDLRSGFMLRYFAGGDERVRWSP